MKVWVECSRKSSEYCRGNYQVTAKAAKKSKTGACVHCKGMYGRTNPNSQYATNDGALDVIDTEGKAYLLGWIASDGHIAKTNSIVIEIHHSDVAVLECLRTVVGDAAINVNTKRKRAIWRASSKQLVRAACHHLGLQQPGKKAGIIQFPVLASDELRWAFLRGYFDGDGWVIGQKASSSPSCGIGSTSSSFLDSVANFVKIPSVRDKVALRWHGANALDFLASLYNDHSEFRLTRKWERALEWSLWRPAALHAKNRFGRLEGLPKARWVKTDPAALPPSKSRASDSGWDVTVIKEFKRAGSVIFYDTGIRVEPPWGWYFQLVARSSLAKTGYMLANAIGIIDRAYTGSVLVALRKMDPTMPDLELPARVAQLIPAPIQHFDWTRVEHLDQTDRAEGGFGSSG